MSEWPAAKARRVLAALLRIGWVVKREASSHKVLSRNDWPDTVFAFHDGDEIGPRMLARIAKKTGLRPEDLRSEVFVRARSNLTLLLAWLGGALCNLFTAVHSFSASYESHCSRTLALRL